MIEEHAKQYPDHIGIVEAESFYSYQEINRKANQIAHHLLDLKLAKECLIAIAVEQSPQLLIAILGIMKSGNGYLPLDARHPINRLQFILEDSKAPILITQSKSKNQFTHYTGHIICLDEIWNERNVKTTRSANPSCSYSENNLAYAIYTSGSTGKPKGVLIEHKSIVNYINWFRDYTDCKLQDRIDFSSSIIFDMAVSTTITALALGLQIVICKEEIKKNPRQYLLYLNKNKINIVKLTPSYFKILIQEVSHNTTDLPHLQSIILGGEILYTKDCKAWLAHYPMHALYNEYGPTETTVAVTQFKVTHKNVYRLESIVPIGKPAHYVNCLVFNKDNKLAPALEIGELYLSGLCLARGYVNQPEKSGFIDDFFHEEQCGKIYKSGDLCRYLADGTIEYVGRIDDQVKIRGYRIEPSEIENCLANHDAIKECRILVRKNLFKDAELYAYYIAKNENIILKYDELKNYLNQYLADYMIPSFFISLEKFPLTENGKLDTKALPEPSFEKNVALPESKIEKKLILIWQKEFHLQNIGIHSNFFNLGGHSLIAIRIISEIEKKFKKTIKLQEFYQNTTIHELATLISHTHYSQKDEGRNSFKMARKPNASLPLSDFQFIFWMSDLFEPAVRNLYIVARRRMVGSIDTDAMRVAFISILKKHKILSSHIGKLFPLLYFKKNKTYQFIIVDLTHCSAYEAHLKMGSSVNEFLKPYDTTKHSPLITAKLFLLKNEVSELQIKISHYYFDDASENLLFEDLSRAYHDYRNNHQNKHQAIQYDDYIRYERTYLNQNLMRDINFWSDYLQDTCFLTLPESEVIENMEHIPYSTYLTVSEEFLASAQKINTVASVSMTEVLGAALTLISQQLGEQLNQNILINIIRSTRDTDMFDHMIGCCLRLDQIKLNLNTNFDFIEIAKSIQQSRINTEKYQNCSSMVKVACINKNYHNQPLKNFFTEQFIKIYCALFPRLNLNPKIVMMYLRLKPLRTKQQFLVVINLLTNFIFQQEETKLFGCDVKNTDHYQCDLSQINNVLDICITRSKGSNKTYLVISGNLKPSFRQWLGEKMITLVNESSKQKDGREIGDKSHIT